MLRRLLMACGSGSGFPDWTRGTLTPDGTPVTILADGMDNVYPGIVRLDATRCLLVFRRGTDSEHDGKVYAKIGTISGTAVSWGTSFLVYTNAQDVRVDDSVSIVDNQVVIAARLFDGTNNHSPFLLICDDPPASLTSGSTWSTVSVPLTAGTKQNAGIGRVLKLQTGTYLLDFNSVNTGAGFLTFNGVMLSSSLTDWSTRTVVTIGAIGANQYTEIDVVEMPDATLVAHLRTEASSPLSHYVSTSTDHGVTWTAPAALFPAWGFPMFRRLTSGVQLAVHRQNASPWQAYWRQSADDGATWSSQALLDGTVIGAGASDSAYASLLQLDSTHVLCVYAIEQTNDSPVGLGNIYSQVFSDSSTR